MNTIRLGLALAACAIAPLALTGCSGDDDKKDSVAEPAAIASPAPVAKKLAQDLSELSVRIRNADAALARVVGDSATDPEERLLALDAAVRAIGSATAVGLGADLKAAGAAIVAGWRTNANAIADAELRRVAVVAGDEAKANFDAVESALRGADAALDYHAALLRDVRVALGARPNATQITAARASAARVTAAGKKVDGWLVYAARTASAAGRSPVPAPVAAAPATPEPVKADPAPVVAPVEAAPKTEAEPAAKPATPEVKPAVPPAPETKLVETKPVPPAVEIEIHGDTKEPQPKPSDPDPIPDPAK